MSAGKSVKRRSVKDKIKHAFSVRDRENPLSEEDLAVVDKAAGIICRRGLASPAILFLQTLTPLSFLSSQLLIVLEPFLGPFFKEEDYKKVIKVLERRKGIELFIQRIEQKANEPKRK